MTRHGFSTRRGAPSVGWPPCWACSCGAGGSLTAPAERLRPGAGCRSGRDHLLHRWAHDPSPPAAARILQRMGIVLHARPACQAPPAAVRGGLLRDVRLDEPALRAVEALDARRGGVCGARTAGQRRRSRVSGQNVCGSRSARHRIAFDAVSLRPASGRFVGRSQTTDRSTAGEPRSSCRWPRVHRA